MIFEFVFAFARQLRCYVVCLLFHSTKVVVWGRFTHYGLFNTRGSLDAVALSWKGLQWDQQRMVSNIEPEA